MNSLVEQILDSPNLPEIVDELRARLQAERVRRERFYEEITEDQKAEFINGEVIIHLPTTVRHLQIRDNLQQLLRPYVQLKNLGWATGEKGLCVFPRNDYEPDVCFFRSEKAARLQPHQLKLPIPDFIAEVPSKSTERHDRREKFQDYAVNGVQEYWIVDPNEEVLEQYVKKGAGYELALKSGSGEVRSVAVDGFHIPVRALFDANLNLEVLRGMLA